MSRLRPRFVRRSPRAAEAGAVLSRHGLDGRRPLAPEELGPSLAVALTALGPVWLALGEWLAWRVDLLPESVRCRLTELPAVVAATPPAACRRRLEAAFGGPPEDHLAAWDEVPWHVGPLEQRHHARAADGSRLEVRLVHPEVEQILESELAALDLLVAALGGGVEGGASLAAAAVDDFRAQCRESVDPPLAARRLSGRLPAAAGLRVPLVVLAAPGVLVLAATEPTARDAGASTSYQRAMAGFRLWRAWLGETWQGGVLPRVARPADLALDGDGDGVVWRGNVAVDVDDATAARLRAYLGAVGEGDAEGAATVLLEEVEAAEAAPADPAALRRRLRRCGTFREARWSGVEGMPGELLSHWRVLAAAGAPPGRAFTAFFQGTAVVTASAGLAAGGPEDAAAAARDALYEVRLHDGFAQLRATLAPDALGPLAVRQALMLAELPAKLDRALSRAVEGDLRVRLDAPLLRRPSPWGRALAAACGLAGLTLAGRAAAAAGVAGAESLTLFALVTLGLWCLAAAPQRGGAG